MKPIPFKENDEVTIPGDDNKYIIMRIGAMGICTIVCGSIKKRMHWSEFDTHNEVLRQIYSVIDHHTGWVKYANSSTYHQISKNTKA